MNNLIIISNSYSPFEIRNAVKRSKLGSPYRVLGVRIGDGAESYADLEGKRFALYEKKDTTSMARMQRDTKITDCGDALIVMLHTDGSVNSATAATAGDLMKRMKNLNKPIFVAHTGITHVQRINY